MNDGMDMRLVEFAFGGLERVEKELELVTKEMKEMETAKNERSSKMKKFTMILAMAAVAVLATGAQASPFDGTTGGSMFVAYNVSSGNPYVHWYKPTAGVDGEVNNIGSYAQGKGIAGGNLQSLAVGRYEASGVQVLLADKANSNIYAFDNGLMNPIDWNKSAGRAVTGIALTPDKYLVHVDETYDNYATAHYASSTDPIHRDASASDGFNILDVDTYSFGGNNYWAYACDNSNIYLKQVNSDGSMTAISNINVSINVDCLAIGDVDNDGVEDDLVFSSVTATDNNIYWYEFTAAGTLTYKGAYNITWRHADAIAIGDPVGDGTSRLVWGNNATRNIYFCTWNGSSFTKNYQASVFAGKTIADIAIDVPEPATLVMLGLGGIGVLIRRRRA